MHPRGWFQVFLLVSMALCAPSRGAPFAQINASVPTNSSSPNLNPPRNPCFDADFQPPFYEFSDPSAVINFFHPREPNGNYYSTVKFRVHDVANNYSLQCTWGPDYQGFAGDWLGGCVPEAGPEYSRTQDLTLLSLVPDSLMKNKPAPGEPIRFLQYWYCDIKNGGYPTAYQSRAAVHFNFTCLDEGEVARVDYLCNISSTFSTPRVKGEWYGPGALPWTPRLIPRPNPSASVAKGLSPPPKSDCTDMSLTHIEWFLSTFSYLPSSASGTARINLTLTSRATGVQASCRFDEYSKTEGSQCILDCTYPSQTDTQSKFTVWYLEYRRTLSVQEDWACGDVKGTSSTSFSASSPFDYTLATYNGDSRFLIAEPVTIPAQLWFPGGYWSPASSVPPPPNTKTPNCLARSQTNRLQLWSITQFLYQRTAAAVAGTLGGGLRGDGRFYPYSRTLQLSLRNNANGFATSCSFSDPILDTLPDTQWFPCNPTVSPHDSPRYETNTLINFNIKTGELRVNQTWYCNDGQQGIPFQINALGSTHVVYDKLISGHSTSAAYNLVCGALIGPLICNVTYDADWWSLGGDRDGRGPEIYLGAGNSDVVVHRLPDNALTSPDPDPSRWSCTVASIGRGPVTWTLQVSDYLALTAWFRHRRSDTTFTRLRFDLNSSVFAGSPGDGIIRDLGNQRPRTYDEDAGVRTIKTTPWLTSWDPTYTYRSEDRSRSYSELGWHIYNILDWSVRFDLITGYMELSHSWYCDDKNMDKLIVFKGTWNGYIPLECRYKFGSDKEGFEDGIVCLPVGGDPVVTPVVTAQVVETKILDPG